MWIHNYVIEYVSGNILKFIDLRIHEGAQQEIQVMAQAVLDIITEIFPVTVGAYRKIKNNE